MQVRTLLASALSLGAVLVGSNVFAAAWLQPNGSTANYSYSNGGDDNGLFGQPTVYPNGFTFIPNNFVASSANGVAAVTSDRLYVTLTANQGNAITSLQIGEVGDYAINNGGGVMASGLLLVQVNDPNWVGNRTFYAGLSTNPSMPQSTAGSAFSPWTGSATVNLPAGANSVTVVLNNILQANSSANGSAIIQKKIVGNGDNPGITIIINNNIPEPATMSIVLGGLSMLGLRRRRAI